MRELDAHDPTRIGPYELLGVLGSGGMGRVYLGQDADGAQVAVKVVHSDLAREPEFRRRFQREIEALRAVSGPGVAAILDADGDAGTQRPWLATEYVDGPSLHQVVTESGTLGEAAVRTLGAGLARTLATIHAARLVHRDVKPTNLLLPEDGPKLIDFGIARDLAASTITRTGLAVGTPQFMAPEQLESGRETGTAADVFALAGLLVFAASGRGPFGDGTPAQLLYAVVHSPPELGDVPTGLRPLLLRCLEKDPAKRPTAARVAQELERPQGAVDSDATVQLDDGAGRSRARRAALAGASALAVAAAVAVVLMDGNGAGADNGGHLAKGGAFSGGAGGMSWSDSSGVAGTGTTPTGGGSGTTPPSGSSVSISGPGSRSGTPVSGSGGGLSGGTTGGSGGASTSSLSTGAHSSSAVDPPTRPVSSSRSPLPPPTSHVSSPSPAGHAPGPVTNLTAQLNGPEYVTMTASWDADAGATSYTVKYTASFHPNTQPITVTGTSATFNAVPGEQVCIQVQAENSVGTSAWSPANPYCVTT